MPHPEGADEDDEVPFRDVERDAVHHIYRTVALGYIGDLYWCHRHAPLMLLIICAKISRSFRASAIVVFGVVRSTMTL